MNKILNILICLILLFSSSDAEQGEVEYVINPQFDGAWAFAEGLARVKIGDRYGFINKERTICYLTPNLTDAEPFSEGLAACENW